MNLKKFGKKISKACLNYEFETGQVASNLVKAKIVLDLIDARVDAGKDCSDIEVLENAACRIVGADSDFNEAMTDCAEASMEVM